METYISYLKKQKKMAENSISAYIKDIEHFDKFVKDRGVTSLNQVSNAEVVAYLMSLKSEGKSKSTVNRKLASIRTYYTYAMENNLVGANPCAEIKSPKIQRKDIEYLSVEDIDRLMDLPDKSIRGVRDRAILELLYATGIRASELIEMKLQDVNLRMGFVKCEGEHGRARIIPIGRMGRKALEDYIFDTRDILLKENKDETLFLNYMGKPITRQGLWKILKEYGDKGEFPVKLTPQVIRNSFAVHMLQNGADIKSLQELMGHEDISATQMYLSVTKNRIKDVYDRTHPRA